MKKLLFSTMAVLAFSVSGMANTIELENQQNYLNIEYIQLEVEETQNDGYSERCFERGIITYYQALGAGY
jgi:hypothetical protein